MNCRNLSSEELASLVESGHQPAIDYLVEHVRELLTKDEERARAFRDSIWEDAQSDGEEIGKREFKESMRDDFETRIEDELAATMNRKDPDELKPKRKRRWELLTDLLQAIT